MLKTCLQRKVCFIVPNYSVDQVRITCIFKFDQFNMFLFAMYMRHLSSRWTLIASHLNNVTMLNCSCRFILSVTFTCMVLSWSVMHTHTLSLAANGLITNHQTPFLNRWKYDAPINRWADRIRGVSQFGV